MVDTAHALFAEHSYRGVTMDAVAAAVGVTKPLLYAYFGNKEQLYLACASRTGDALAAAVDKAVAAAPTPGDALKAALRTYFALVERDERAWRVLYDPTLPTAGVIADWMQTTRGRIAAPVARAFSALDGGGLGTGDRQDGRQFPSPARAAQAEALAHGQLAAAEAMSRWWLATGALPAAHLAELLIDTLEPGLAQRALAAQPALQPGAP